MKWKKMQKNQKALQNIMGRIEIINRDKDIDVVYFQIPQDVIKYWNTSIISNYRDELIDNVKRDNPEEKVKDFFDKSELLMYAVEHRARLAQTKGKLCGLGSLLYLSLTCIIYIYIYTYIYIFILIYYYREKCLDISCNYYYFGLKCFHAFHLPD